MSQSFVLQQQLPIQKQFAIPPNGLNIGRTPENAVQLVEDVVSRHHATLWVQGAQAFIRDEDTTNGTFVRGQRIAAKTPQTVQPGDEIRIGGATFVLAVAQPGVVAAPGKPSSALSTPALVIGGAVLASIVLIALVLVLTGRSASTQPGALPSLTPPPSATQPPVSPSATLPSATPTTAPTAAPGQAPIATSKPATPTNVLTLLEPADGVTFSGSGAYIMLRWKSERSLASGEVYVVTVDCQRPANLPAEMGRTDQTQWQVPAQVYSVLTDPRQCKWWVNIASSAGSPVTPPSVVWTFTWAREKNASPESTPKIEK